MSAMKEQIGPIRLSADDKGLIESVAAQKGIKPASWIRLCAVTASKKALADERRRGNPHDLAGSVFIFRCGCLCRLCRTHLF